MSDEVRLKVLFGHSRTMLMDGMQGLKKLSVSERPAEFRASSLPYCPLLFLEKGNSLIKTEHPSHYYFSVGTALHELMQRWLPMTDALKWAVWGNWECSRCGHLHEKCVEPKACANHNCGLEGPFKYEEIALHWKGLSGHVDFILQLRDRKTKQKYYVVVDFKTASLSGYTDKSKYPVPNNVFQISAYCAILRNMLGINVIGWHLIYLDRSRPVRSASDFHPVSRFFGEDSHKLWSDRIERWCAHHALVLKYKAKAEAEVRQGLLKKLVRDRPCVDLQSHDELMAASFHYEGGKCPHAGVCCERGPKTIRRYFEKRLKAVYQ